MTAAHSRIARDRLAVGPSIGVGTVMHLRHATQADCEYVEAELNNRPRLRLRFRTPREVFPQSSRCCTTKLISSGIRSTRPARKGRANERRAGVDGFGDGASHVYCARRNASNPR